MILCACSSTSGSAETVISVGSRDLTEGAPGAPGDVDVDAVLADAQSLVEQHQELRALHVVDDALGSRGGRSAVLRAGSKSVLTRRRAELLLTLHALDPARIEMERYLATAPEDGQAWGCYGQILEQLGKFGRASDAVSRAVTLGCRTQEVEEASRRLALRVASLKEDLEDVYDDPEDVGADYWWGRLRMEVALDRMQAAESTVLQWEEGFGETAATLWGWGFLSTANGKFADARKMFEQVRDGGDRTRAEQALVIVASAQGAWSELIERSVWLLAKDPRDLRTLRLVAGAFVAQGQYERYADIVDLLYEVSEEEEEEGD